MVQVRGRTTGIRDIAHKMLPMFRQLGVRECIPILEELERLPDGTTPGKIASMATELKTKVDSLGTAVEDYLIRLRVDID